MRGGKVGLTLENGANSIGTSFISEEASGITLRAAGKRIGEFDEQNTWKGGRGGERLAHDPTKYFDSKDAWTLSPNHAIPTIQWKFARGLRNEDFHMAGSKEFIPLLGANKYISVSFAASASYTVNHSFAWLRRKGNPKDISFCIYSDSAGEPNAAIDLKVASSFSDILSVLHDFETYEALTSGTTYHVVLYAGADTAANYWEVACDTTASGYVSSDGTTWVASTYSPYYRLVDTDVDKRWWMFIFKGALYAVDNKAVKTASSLYINGSRGTATSASSTSLTDTSIGWTADRWIGAYVRIIAGTGIGQVRAITDNTTDSLTVATWSKTPDATSEYVIYGTEWWKEIGTTGLGVVTGRPVSANGVVYFPQGASDNIREMRMTGGAHAFDDNGTAKADVLFIGDNAADGPQVWKALAQNVARADVTAWGTDLVFRTAIPCGDSEYSITNMLTHDNQLYVFKPDGIWTINNDRAVALEYGIKNTPDDSNGQAAISHNKFLYFNWLFSTEQDYGGTLTDIGQGWREPAMPYGREGVVGSYESYVAWLFAAIDAGTGTSSILAYDGFGWHEIARAYKSGKRIREVKIQPCQETRNRLWFDCGGDLLYQVWPKGKANPLYDSGVDYMHEAVIESAALDMGTASRLPKFVSYIYGFSKSLKGGTYVGMSYQVDDNVGTSKWINISALTQSPEDKVLVNAENIGRLSYRMILNTNNQKVPPDVQGIQPSGFARAPFRRVFNIRVKVGQGFTRMGTKAVGYEALAKFLDEASEYPGLIRMTSESYSKLNNVAVIILPTTENPVSGSDIGKQEKASILIKMMSA